MDSPEPRPETDLLPPFLIRAPEAARLCGIGEATWHRLNAAQKIPASIPLGGSVLWSVEELHAWIRARCPCRRDWEAIQDVRIAANGQGAHAGAGRGFRK
jgi:predicted DNA-binding transcriptional regulator AlpA